SGRVGKIEKFGGDARRRAGHGISAHDRRRHCQVRRYREGCELAFRGVALRKAMKTIAAALTSAVLLGSAPASATEIDLSAWTCKQFQAASKEDVDITLAWLDGYYRAEADPSVIDRDQLAANARKLAAFCSTHPDVKLITAAATLFERE